ncbi:hypothetical protein WISP_54488 [Willisornis vidua]|uniref:Uncharacterized protein n=1 Tax=Willisornis vidua TaxID=1566151 RepID=A0ABQ9DIM3_9PASS|nr:hypothetical protein WISP_54488 [Willisornis vidua]
MERQTEINRFAIFLFCLLVPLGCSAPTEVPRESKITTGQRQKRFTTDIKTLVSVIEKRATDLFEYYTNCVNQTLQGKTQLLNKSKAKEMVQRIPECPALHANCCALHHIYSILQALRGEVGIMCGPTSHTIVSANLIQLNTTLSEGQSFYTCQALPQGHPSQGQPRGSADTMSYIWGVLEKYQQIMQKTKQMYSEAAS